MPGNQARLSYETRVPGDSERLTQRASANGYQPLVYRISTGRFSIHRFSPAPSTTT